MSDTPFARMFSSNRFQSNVDSNPRRTTHSASGWTLPSGLESLRQPQDGALTNANPSAQMLVRTIDGRSSNLIAEAEDARLSGSLRSLARRVNGLNVISSQAVDFVSPGRHPVDSMAKKISKSKRGVVETHPQVA